MISVVTPTHDPRHLAETHASLLAQAYRDWEWVVVPNGGVSTGDVRRALEPGGGARDLRIRVELGAAGPAIGAIKRDAFRRARGSCIVELDHDDRLASDALAQIVDAFAADDAPDFVYSNCADIRDGDTSVRYPEWEANGFRYRDAIVDGIAVAECVAFPPSAAALSLIYYAPNHVRAWRKSFYHAIGGHDPSMAIADDHELLIRTYLRGRMKHIDRCLYLYRRGAQNTFSGRVDEIRKETYDLHARHIEALALREGELRGLPCYDLGGAFDCPIGWTPVDRSFTNADDPRPSICANLEERWPFEDSSVVAFRAHDIIEHLADKRHVMSELHRCLVPGGWALISVPSTDGRGAFQDPTHVSFWNQNSFWYWTRRATAKYIDNQDQMFMIGRLGTGFPSEWHRDNLISYTTAELVAHKGEMIGIPGVRP